MRMRTSSLPTLTSGEVKAKFLKLNRWKNFTEVVAAPVENLLDSGFESLLAQNTQREPIERIVAQKKIVITEITPEIHF